MGDGAGPVLVIGESLVDVVRHGDGAVEEHPGGSPANVAVALARLGARVELATAYAEDRLGVLLHQHLTSAGVALAGSPHVVARTSSASATLDASGSATYVFDLDGTLPTPAPSAQPLHVHTGSIGAVLPPGASTVLAALDAAAATATVSYDINARPAATGLDEAVVARIEAVAARADVVKASDEDLELVYPGDPVESVAGRLLDRGASAVVVTYGAQGAACHTAQGVVDLPGRSVTVADTIGAGDSFCATTIDGLLRLDLLGAHRREALRELPLDTWRQVLARATRAASITVSRQGANPPTEADLVGDLLDDTSMVLS